MIPKLNDKPLFEVVIPSTGETHRFRPYLVKEEKVLLMAHMSGDRKTILKAISDTVESCLEKDVDFDGLTLYDVQYLFSKIRGKSVGEEVPLTIKCKHCGTDNEVSVNIDNLTSKVAEEREKKIDITSNVTVLVRHPSYNDMMNDPIILSTETTDPERMIRSVAKSIVKIFTDDDKVDVKDEPEELVVEFVESLDQKQFKKIMDFVRSAPSLEFDASFDCKECHEHNEVKVAEEQTFF
jgi:hypothetical protein